MPTADKNTTWKISADLGKITTSNASKTLTIDTSGKYVDRNIEVTVSATKPDAATLGASATGSATIDSVSVGTKTNSTYPLTGNADISGTANATTTKAGYASTSTTGSGSTTGTASLNASLPAAAATVTFGGNAANPTIALDTAAATKSTANVGTITTTKPSSGAYVSVKATAPGTTLSATTKTVTTPGYLGDVSEITASAKTTAKTGSTYYVPVTAGSLSFSELNTKTSSNALKDYTENTTVAIPSEGSLLINAGYYPNTFISLDQLLNGRDEDKATAATGTSDFLQPGSVMWTEDGKKVTGSMPNATFSDLSGSVDGTATMGNPSYNSTSNKFDVELSGSNSGTVTSKSNNAGYIAANTTAKSGTISGTISGSGELNKIALSTSKTSGNLTVAPTLARTAKPSGDAWVDAASGAATTTKPTTADPYIQIDAAAATNTLKIKPTVATAGYGDTTNYGFTEYSGTVGSAKATTRYVPITKGTAGTPSATVTASVGTWTKQTSGTNAGKYTAPITGTNTTGATVTNTTGWITGSTKTGTATASGTAVLDAAKLTHGGASGTAGSVTKTVTGVQTSTTDTGYKVTFGVTSGTIICGASVSAGYTEGESVNATITATPSKPADVYFATKAVSGAGATATAAATATESVAKNSVTGYNAPVTVAANTTVPQLVMTATGGATATASASHNITTSDIGKVISSVTTTAGSDTKTDSKTDTKYINYYTGSYSFE